MATAGSAVAAPPSPTDRVVADAGHLELPALESRVRHRLDQHAARADGPELVSLLAVALTVIVGGVRWVMTTERTPDRPAVAALELASPRGPPSVRGTSMHPV